MAETTDKTRPWDVVEHLQTPKDMAAYLNAALEDGDPAVIVATLGDIAHAKRCISESSVPPYQGCFRASSPFALPGI
jgi:DNA-binding phage protein